MFQNTREWLEWRVLGVGSSDGPVIMGKSEYKTKLELWDEKFGKIVKEEEPNFIQKKGHRLEVLARSAFEFRTGFEWKPRLFTHAQYDFIRASMDGWNEVINEGWECKYMGKELYLRLIDTKLSILERIPEQYLDQICHQFFVTGARAITLSGVNDTIEVDEAGNKITLFGHLRIPLTDELKKYIQETYAPAVFEFWNSVQSGVRPEPVKDDVVNLDDSTNMGKALGELILKYAEIDKEEKKLKGMKDKCKELIFKHPNRTHSKMAYSGNQIMLVPGGKSVDYKAAFEAFCSWIHQIKTAALNFEMDQHSVWQSVTSFPDKPNLEAYTKVSADSFKIIPLKEKKEKKDESKTDAPGTTETKPETQVDALSNGNTQGAEPKADANSSMVSEDKKEILNANISKPSFDFINPITKKRPRNWEKKTLREKMDYCIKESKVAGIGIENAKVFLDFAETLEAEIEKEKQTAGETVAGITFTKE